MLGRDGMMNEINLMVDSRRKYFGPGSTGSPELSADGRTCTVVIYDVDHVHEGEGDSPRWDLAWVSRIHPGEECGELQFDLEAGLSRERLVQVGLRRWSEWADPFGPDGCLGRYRSDEEIRAAARAILEAGDDPATARLRNYTGGEEWQGDDLWLLRAAAMELGRKSRS